ncbi:hypothetical protein TcCL_NonESM06996 [Trypanosoma cruzi]|nr:hypothetical protein TcCL_NonESM06996 [Trypanosoma cruzi]
MPYYHLVAPTSATNTRRAVGIGSTTNFKHKVKRSGHSTCIWRTTSIEMDVFLLGFQFWVQAAQEEAQSPRSATPTTPQIDRVLPRRRQRQAEEAADRDKQQQQCHHRESGTGLLAVRLAASILAPERRFSRSVGASWPDPLLLWRRMLLGNSRVDILWWCTVVGLNALRNGDGCPLGSLVQ